MAFVHHEKPRQSDQSGQETGPVRKQWNHFALLIALCVSLYLPGLFAIPPVDRDESRFAQATKQMIESGDYIRIRFQDEPRHKKPVGIYWLQAASVHGGSAIGVPDAPNQIWLYRIPSVLGACVAALVLCRMTRRFIDERAALIAGALLASSILLVVEAHLATTDAVVLACVVTAQSALASILIETKSPNKSEAASRGRFAHPPITCVIQFWVALGIAFLIKGPVPLLPSTFTLLTFALVIKRDWQVLMQVRWLIGIPMFLLIVLPWAIAIHIASDGTFWRDALMGDLFPKVVSGVESHGFLPGYYLILVWVTFWPGSMFLGWGVIEAWKTARQKQSSPDGSNRDSDSHDSPRKTQRAFLQFALAWFVPMWIIMELVPTKLPHYVLPLYPALATLVAHTLSQHLARFEDDRESPNRFHPDRFMRIGFVMLSLVMLCAGIGVAALPFMLNEPIGVWSIMTMVAVIVTVTVALVHLWCGRFRRALMVNTIGSVCILAPSLHGVLPTIDAIWPSRTIHAQLEAYAATSPADDNPIRLIAAGFHEPSLVFLTDKDTVLTSGRRGANTWLNDPEQYDAIVVAGRARPGLHEALAEQGFTSHPVFEFRAFNYSTGDWLDFEVHQTLKRIEPTP